MKQLSTKRVLTGGQQIVPKPETVSLHPVRTVVTLQTDIVCYP